MSRSAVMTAAADEAGGEPGVEGVAAAEVELLGLGLGGGSDAVGYEKRWVAADPNRRRTALSCAGHLTNHNDGTYDCTQLADCPGPEVPHPAYTRCSCPDCHARPWTQGSGCLPDPRARRNRGNADA